ncbi:hypothetical protein [Pseudaminobacter sp. NGMCC 1.201702]|uniref:hypothetical protein n=1 Tax=Pseudaminobacter sp. NGMCC 1.201702 TaxID=3391825 RepID=UPI0039F10405
MSDKPAAEIEREAEIARARVADTAESIRSKMTPGQLIDEFTGLFTGGETSTAVSNLKAQIRDNPLPLTLVGAGLAWLMFGEGASARSSDSMDMRRMSRTTDGSASDFGTAGSEWGSGDGTRSSGGSIASTLSGAAEAVTSAAGSAAEAVKTSATGAGRRLSGTASDYGASAAGMAARARHRAEDLFEREPLLVAALGLAVGTAIGAMLPRTAVEDEQMGRYRDKARDAAGDLLQQGIEGAKDVAAEAYSTIKEEADRQGLRGGGDTSMVEQVSEVAKSAAARTEEAVRERMGAQPRRPENT